jgi:hypothetical protein
MALIALLLSFSLSQKWNVHSSATPASTNSEDHLEFEQLPKPSRRSGLILNRFSRSCPIMHCTDDNFLPANLVAGRSIYDFVAERDEPEVRSWIDMAKGWGIEGPEPSEGGFGYGRFHLCIPGRNSAAAKYVIHSCVQPCSPAKLALLLAG